MTEAVEFYSDYSDRFLPELSAALLSGLPVPPLLKLIISYSFTPPQSPVYPFVLEIPAAAVAATATATTEAGTNGGSDPNLSARYTAFVSWTYAAKSPILILTATDDSADALCREMAARVVHRLTLHFTPELDPIALRAMITRLRDRDATYIVTTHSFARALLPIDGVSFGSVINYDLPLAPASASDDSSVDEYETEALRPATEYYGLPSRPALSAFKAVLFLVPAPVQASMARLRELSYHFSRPLHQIPTNYLLMNVHVERVIHPSDRPSNTTRLEFQTLPLEAVKT